MTDEHANPEEEARDAEQQAGEAQAETTADDPLQKVAGAMMTAAEAVQEGASDAKAKAQQMAPAVGRAVSKSVYATCYYLSYGVVFPTLLVASVIPLNNPVGHGLTDGAAAAKDAVEHLNQRRAAMKAARKQALDEMAAAQAGNGGAAPAPA